MLKQPSSEYRGFRAAGVRLREEILPQLSRLAAGRSKSMLHVFHAFDKAQAVMLVEEGLLSREHGRAILEALRKRLVVIVLALVGWPTAARLTPLFPGNAIFFTVLSFNLAGEALNEMLDPRARTTAS
jgi:hypothetical protein